jgi:hypothetical protein
VAQRPGEQVALRSFPPELGTGRGMTELTGGRDSFDVLQLRAAAQQPGALTGGGYHSGHH